MGAFLDDSEDFPPCKRHRPSHSGVVPQQGGRALPPGKVSDTGGLRYRSLLPAADL